jgi:hypothetical protein
MFNRALLPPSFDPVCFGGATTIDPSSPPVINFLPSVIPFENTHLKKILDMKKRIWIVLLCDRKFLC